MTHAPDGCLVISVTDAVHAWAAEGVRSRLDRQAGGEWRTLARYVSDLTGIIVIEKLLRPATYRLLLDVDRYFALTGTASALPQRTVVFRIPETAGRWHLDIYITASTHFVAFSKAP